MAAAAVGHDPGEPYNVEDVRIRVFEDLEHAIVTYRGRGVEVADPDHGHAIMESMSEQAERTAERVEMQGTSRAAESGRR